MAETDVRTVHAHPRSDAHARGDSSASRRHGRSLLLIGGLELSSQVLPVEDEDRIQMRRA